MRYFALVVNITIAGAAERLNRKDVTFFHLGCVGRLDDRNALCPMNAVRENRMASQVANRLDRIRSAVDLALVAFHRLLDPLSQLSEAHIDAGLLDTRVGGILDSRQ